MRYSAAMQSVWISVERVARSSNLEPPPPGPRTDHAELRAAYEAERLAAFLGKLAAKGDGGAVTPLVPVDQIQGSIGDGYNHEEAMAAQAEANKPKPKPQGRPAKP